MILKIGYGNIIPTRLFRYEEDCENVECSRIGLKSLLTEYKQKYSNKETFEDIQSFLAFRISEFEKKNKNQNFNPIDVISRELHEVFLEVCGVCCCGITETNDLDRLANSLLQGKLDNNDIACKDIRMVAYEKDGSSYGIFKTFQPIYLLNNNGKTVEVIK